jgi:hypothetical protein
MFMEPAANQWSQSRRHDYFSITEIVHVQGVE